MTRAKLAAVAFAATLAFLVLLGVGLDLGHRALERAAERSTAAGRPTPAESSAPANGPAATAPANVAGTTPTGGPATTPSNAAQPGFLYGRVTTTDGAVHTGPLRFGADEEALWGHYFNGAKDGNPWAEHVPPERLPTERVSFGLFGIEIAGWEMERNLGRQFMARFGDIARIEPFANELQVMLKSGAIFELDRFGADDVGDGIRVWDAEYGVVDIGDWRIGSIEFLADPGPSPEPDTGDSPLHGTVGTRQGDFSGFIQWNREQSLGSDQLVGRSADGDLRLRFDAIGSIARRGEDAAAVTLRDGREIALSGTPDVGDGNRGMYVDDPRYGRVLVSWDAFERVDFLPGGSLPAYGDFPPGRPLSGSVLTRSGRLLSGRLVYDLDESETTETLDAPVGGVDYTIPFGLVASVVPPGSDADADTDSDADSAADTDSGPGEEPGGTARVTLHSGIELRLEASGDLGDQNAGVLIFLDGRESPEYVAWREIERIDFERPSAMYPPARSAVPRSPPPRL